jgi:predicted methyltransferase
MKIQTLSIACLAVCLPFSPAQTQTAAPDPVAAAVASPDRPAADVARDALRRPSDLVRFAGVKPGDRVADIMPGQGYFTRIFARVVGPNGHVFEIVPAELAQVFPPAAAAAKALAAEPAYANVTALVEPTASIAAPEPLDVAWTSDNYHDLYGFFGPQEAAALDAAVFKSLKPGGVFVVIDHVAAPGTSATSAKTLHRIDPETVKAQALAAGFTLDAQSDVLRNPSDTHDLVVFSPKIRGRTDQFAFRFIKPLKQ